MERLYIGNDHLITLEGLQDQDGAAITAATVEATLYERDRTTEVEGVTWPVTLTHTSEGSYEGQLADSLTLIAGRRYRMKITASAGTANLEQWADAYAEYRDA